MNEWKLRLTRDLEPVLREPDPRAAISAYHNMPYAIFHYPPDEELEKIYKKLKNDPCSREELENRLDMDPQVFEKALEEGQGLMVATHGSLSEGIDPLVVVESNGPEAVIRRLTDLPIGGTDPEFAGQVQMPEAALFQQFDGFLADRTVPMEEGNLT